MLFDSKPLQKALSRLIEGLHRYEQNTDDAQIRDGLVQRFEFTYEIAHKSLKRLLEAMSATPGEYDTMAFADLIRAGAEQNFLQGGWPLWKRFRDMRARTSHAYDEAVAVEVVKGIPEFILEVTYFVDRLKDRTGGAGS